jgi:leader peptidase (prepilin peptidase)/N-methyltransferase
MHHGLVLLTALVTGAVGGALSPWVRTVAGADSVWLRRRNQVLLAGLGGAGASTLAHGPAELVGFVLLALACALLVGIDLAVHRLPNIIVGPLYPVLLTALTVQAALDGGDWTRLARAAAGGAASILSYLALALLVPSGLGLGDVKLAGLLGVFLGWAGWPHVLLGALAAFALNAVVAAVLLLSRRVTRKGATAFGPWMVAGAAIGAFWGPALGP